MRAYRTEIAAASSPVGASLARLGATVALVALCGCGSCGERAQESSPLPTEPTPAPTGSMLGRRHLVGPKRRLAIPLGPASRPDGAPVVEPVVEPGD
ncbi:MAG TPA: hypothetical protein PLR99_16805 [Polyangiaceae bacterium]|nr:hypothetical protein [Polyangiaceae bacterium]